LGKGEGEGLESDNGKGKKPRREGKPETTFWGKHEKKGVSGKKKTRSCLGEGRGGRKSVCPRSAFQNRLAACRGRNVPGSEKEIGGPAGEGGDRLPQERTKSLIASAKLEGKKK